MKHQIPHSLSPALAKQAAEKALEAYTERFPEYNPTSTWVSDSRAEIQFKAKGIKVEGALELASNSIDMELDVPFIFRPLRKKALALVEEQVQKWIKAAESGELEG